MLKQTSNVRGLTLYHILFKWIQWYLVSWKRWLWFGVYTQDLLKVLFRLFLIYLSCRKLVGDTFTVPSESQQQHRDLRLAKLNAKVQVTCNQYCAAYWTWYHMISSLGQRVSICRKSWPSPVQGLPFPGWLGRTSETRCGQQRSSQILDIKLIESWHFQDTDRHD